MRVGDVVLVLGAMRLRGDEIIRPPAADPVPVQDNPKRAQINVFQSDRGGYHRGRAVLEIQFHLFELVLQGNQVRKDLAGRGNQGGRGAHLQALTQMLDFPQQAAGCVVEIDGQRLRGSVPPAVLSKTQPLRRLAQFLPGAVWQVQLLATSGRTQQMLVDLDGSAERLPP
jgi:hypothetical protein